MEKFPPGKSPVEKPTDSQEKATPRKALILENGEEKIYDDATVFLERERVRDWVRFTPEEFEAIDTARQYLDHFNFGEIDNVVGQKYIAMKILRGGVRSSDPQQTKPPLLSLDDALIMECTETEKGLPYDALSERYFEYAINGISDSKSLEDANQKKHMEVTPGLIEEDVTKAGVTYTRFKFIEKAQK